MQSYEINCLNIESSFKAIFKFIFFEIINYEGDCCYI